MEKKLSSGDHQLCKARSQFYDLGEWKSRKIFQLKTLLLENKKNCKTKEEREEEEEEEELCLLIAFIQDLGYCQ